MTEELQLKYTQAVSLLDGKSRDGILSSGAAFKREKLVDIALTMKETLDELYAFAMKTTSKQTEIIENTCNMIANCCIEKIQKKVDETIPADILGLNSVTDVECSDSSEQSSSYAQMLKSNRGNHVVKNIVKDVVSLQSKEEKERKERENNVIMFNLDEDPTTENENDNKDKDFVENLCKNILEIPNIKVQKMFRLGRKSETKIRPLKMVFENNSDKRVFFGNLYKLKNSEPNIKKVSICQDLTLLQREELNGLL